MEGALGPGTLKWRDEQVIDELRMRAGVSQVPIAVAIVHNSALLRQGLGNLLRHPDVCVEGLYASVGGDIASEFWDFLVQIVEHVNDHWEEPDEGIWEVRGGPRQFVYSKVMAWVAVDRALKLAKARNLPADVERWTALRDEIRQRVESEGTDPATGAFVQSFGSTAMDASSLLLPLIRFLPAQDPRIAATVREVERQLSRAGLVYRYRETDDSLAGGEAAFAICSFWLVDNLVLAGQVERGRALFEQLLGYLNDVGLLAEQIDPASGEHVGNFPQAFSHLGLINSALQLARADNTRST